MCVFGGMRGWMDGSIFCGLCVLYAEDGLLSVWDNGLVGSVCVV